MKLSEMRELLAREGIQLTKSLGQNFLHDANQLRRIVDAAELTRQDKVLEIGPGLGPLTDCLLERAGEVLAIEKDARLVKLLQARLSTGSEGRVSPSSEGRAMRVPDPERTLREESLGSAQRVPPNQETVRPLNLRLLHDDALEYLKREPRDWSLWKLVANLPFSVASPILVELACGARAPERMIVTLQLEVAKRLLAQPGDKDYGVLTLLVRVDFEPRGWFKIPAGCFFPEPDVDSACVCLRRRPQPLLPPDRREKFRALVKRGFSQRRKMMLKLLKEDWSAETLVRAFEQLKLSATLRAEAVTLEQFIQLSEILCASGLSLCPKKYSMSSMTATKGRFN
jgi:16S rRNA (adenine1518-N6/adenine1519-N6)-dimethyltransferase